MEFSWNVPKENERVFKTLYNYSIPNKVCAAIFLYYNETEHQALLCRAKRIFCCTFYCSSLPWRRWDSCIQRVRIPLLPAEMQLPALQRLDGSNSIIQQAALVNHMQTHSGYIDWHSDKKPKHREPRHLRQKNPEPGEERGESSHEIVTQHFQYLGFPELGKGLSIFYEGGALPAQLCPCVTRQNKSCAVLLDGEREKSIAGMLTAFLKPNRNDHKELKHTIASVRGPEFLLFVYVFGVAENFYSDLELEGNWLCQLKTQIYSGGTVATGCSLDPLLPWAMKPLAVQTPC